MEAEYQRVRRLLEGEFQAAVRRREEASCHFDNAIRRIPRGVPHPNRAQDIVDASVAYSAALRDVSRAVQRIADFQIRGIVPTELRDASDTAESSGSDSPPSFHSPSAPLSIALPRASTNCAESLSHRTAFIAW